MNMLSNTRKWSTPVIIGTGVFVSVSGIMMFFGVHNPIELAHEWIGLLFAFAIFFHAANHWPTFRKYFSQRVAIGILSVITITISGFIFASLTQDGGNVLMNVIHSIESSPLSEVSLLLNSSPENVIANLELSGFSVSGIEQTLHEIAVANGSDSKELMGLLFSK